MRNNEESFLPALEIVIKPDNSVEVQVISRFIQHQQCGFQEQSSENHGLSHGYVIPSQLWRTERKMLERKIELNRKVSFHADIERLPPYYLYYLARDTRILHPPEKSLVGRSCISLVNCRPDKIRRARPSAALAPIAFNSSWSSFTRFPTSSFPASSSASSFFNW